MLSYARTRGLRRSFLLLPYVPTWFMAFGIGLMTPVPYRIAHALVAGLSSDSAVLENNALETFPEIQLADFESAAAEALTHLHPLRIEPIWADGQNGVKALKHEGFFIDHRQVWVQAAPEKVFEVIRNMGGKAGWPFANWLWRLRARIGPALPAPFGGASRGEGLGVSENLQVGDQIDFYTVDFIGPGHLLLRSRLVAPGAGWMEWRVRPDENGTRLTQTAYFAPRGLGGFAYWYLPYSIRAFVLRGLVRAIADRAGRPA